jgi:hypothetical protein
LPTPKSFALQSRTSTIYIVEEFHAGINLGLPMSIEEEISMEVVEVLLFVIKRARFGFESNTFQS